MARALGLHTALRRFCMDQFSFYVREYEKCQSKEHFRIENYFDPDWTYSAEACRLFPRYRMADATLLNLEARYPDAETTEEEVCSRAKNACRSAFDILSDELRLRKHSDIALEALIMQSAAFETYLSEVRGIELENVPPLPFRRILGELEGEAMWDLLLSKWKVQDRGCGWWPLTADDLPDGAFAVHADLWEARKGDELLLRFLSEQKLERCFLLREIDPLGFEMEASLAKAAYDGSECFLVDRNEDWVVYVSHQSSLTMAGSIADFFRDQWPDVESVAYRGPFSTADLRGSENL